MGSQTQTQAQTAGRSEAEATLHSRLNAKRQPKPKSKHAAANTHQRNPHQQNPHQQTPHQRTRSYPTSPLNPLFGPGSRKSSLSNTQPEPAPALENLPEMAHTDESSDDDDSEAIADALRGRPLNSGLLFGRMLPTRKTSGACAHKEDGELSDEDRDAGHQPQDSAQTSLLARIAQSQGGQQRRGMKLSLAAACIV